MLVAAKWSLCIFIISFTLLVVSVLLIEKGALFSVTFVMYLIRIEMDVGISLAHYFK